MVLAGADLTTTDPDSHTLLHFAALHVRGNPVIIQSMLKHGASVDEQTAKGSTALHLAVTARKKSAMLVNSDRINVFQVPTSATNAADPNGNTVFIAALALVTNETYQVTQHIGALCSSERNCPR